MILRRLSQHIRRQDWFTVLVELVVVVVGIFLGLQVTNWNEERIAQRELDTYLDSLATEFKASADMLENHIAWHARVMDGLRLTLRALEGEPLGEAQREAVHFALVQGFSPPPYPIKREVLLEMQSTGMLQRLPRGDLKSALAEVSSQARVADLFYERTLRTLTAPPLSPDIVRYDARGSEHGRQDGFLAVTGVDFERARQDPEFRLRVLQGLAVFAETRLTKQHSLKMHHEVLRLLAARGHQPSANWLQENIDRILAEAPRADREAAHPLDDGTDPRGAER